MASMYANWFLLQKIQSTDRTKNKALRDANRLLVRGQEAQAQANADKRRFVEALGEAFLLIGPSGHIVLANSLACDLFQEEKLEGRNITSLVCNQELLSQLQDVFQSNTPVTKDFTLNALNSPSNSQAGITAWQVDSAITEAPIREKHILIRNITQSYLTNQMRRDFVANASHELRTPLTIIVGYLENLMEDGILEENPSLCRKFLNTMNQHSQRLMHIIEDMLMISKLEAAHKGLLKERWFSLSACIQDVFSRLESIQHKKKAILTTNIQETQQLFGDPFYWTQILFNLVENALKQNTKEGLAVRVQANVTATHLILSVSDNGIGIPTESIPFLFNRFYRVDTQHSSEIKGTGLGLSIVKRAVEAHDSTIAVTSTPNVETTFTITIPLSRYTA